LERIIVLRGFSKQFNKVRRATVKEKISPCHAHAEWYRVSPEGKNMSGTCIKVNGCSQSNNHRVEGYLDGKGLGVLAIISRQSRLWLFEADGYMVIYGRI